MLVAKRTQATQIVGGHRGNAALALHGFDQNGAGFGRDRRLDQPDVVGRDMGKAGEWRTEAFDIVRIAGRRDRAQRAAVERAGERDDLVALRLALGEVIVPRGLDGALDRLSARVGEEHRVRESRIDQALTEPFLLGDREDVGGVPYLFGRLLQRLDQMRVGVTERIDRDAGVEIEISGSVLRDEAHALAPLESEWRSGVGAIQRGHDVPLGAR